MIDPSRDPAGTGPVAFLTAIGGLASATGTDTSTLILPTLLAVSIDVIPVFQSVP
jgi:hypothetical protein